MQLLIDSVFAADESATTISLYSAYLQPRGYDFAGLSGSTATVLQELLELTRNIIPAGSSREVQSILLASLPVLTSKMRAEGLDGWIGWVFARELLGYLSMRLRAESETQSEEDSLEFLVNTDLRFQEVVTEALAFDIPLGSSDPVEGGGAPLRVRTHAHGELVSVSSLLLQSICERRPVVPAFLSNVQIANETVYEMISNGLDLEMVLAGLGDLNRDGYSVIMRPLPREIVEEIVAIASCTDEGQVLRASLWVLLYSNFEDLAGVKLVVRMVQSCARSDYFPALLFNDSRLKLTEASDAARQVLREVANTAKMNYHSLAESFVRAALTYLYATESQRFTNIVDLEDELGVHTKLKT